MEEPQAGPTNTGHRTKIKKVELIDLSHVLPLLKPLQPVNNTNCSVPGCHSSKKKDKNIHFHHFPSKNSSITVPIVNDSGEEEEVDKREAWEKVLYMGEWMGRPISKSTVICSKHFRNEDYCAREVVHQLNKPKLIPTAVPSQNLPDKDYLNLREKKAIERARLRAKSISFTLLTPKIEMKTEEDEYSEEKPVTFYEIINSKNVKPLSEVGKNSNEDSSVIKSITESENLIINGSVQNDDQSSKDESKISSEYGTLTTENESRYNAYCCVYGCESSRTENPNLYFHTFPKENSGIMIKTINKLGERGTMDKRKAWEKVLLIGQPALQKMRVCSKHFREEDYIFMGPEGKRKPRLKPFVVPSKNLPKVGFMKTYRSKKILDTETLLNEESLSQTSKCGISTREDKIIKNEAESRSDSENEIGAVALSPRINEQVDKVGVLSHKSRNVRKRKSVGGSSKTLPQKLKLTEESSEGEDLEDVQLERGRLEEKLKCLEEDYEALVEKRLRDLAAAQIFHEREKKKYFVDLTPLQDKLDNQQETISKLEQQLTSMKNALVVAETERDRLKSELQRTISKGEAEEEIMTCLLKKISRPEKRDEVCECGLKTILQDVVKKMIKSENYEECQQIDNQVNDRELLELLES
ncbi:unnamed protein product [Acanthoscelides obtectus]|uniref:THAP-type domain-containing protein n=1 Tax=Acanthoscelides obtectus TaxID=200917 RepID=A0A9P0LG11_ACAOB|nr:unnamed protein product [Acanthoscelides obtectus]CAK1667159.1 hypothetical protein AOBTE_LOCUS25703 [Acanthoscelides obtectus]